MKRFYTMEVHFVDYDTVGLTAESEQEAHERARIMFETAHDHIIGVCAVGTVGVDGEEIEDYEGEHMTRWEVA